MPPPSARRGVQSPRRAGRWPLGFPSPAAMARPKWGHRPSGDRSPRTGRPVGLRRVSPARPHGAAAVGRQAGLLPPPVVRPITGLAAGWRSRPPVGPAQIMPGGMGRDPFVGGGGLRPPLPELKRPNPGSVCGCASGSGAGGVPWCEASRRHGSACCLTRPPLGGRPRCGGPVPVGLGYPGPPAFGTWQDYVTCRQRRGEKRGGGGSDALPNA